MKKFERIIYNPVNFRDLGGISCQNGTKVIPKRLLRCGQLFDLAQEDVALLQNTYKISKVVDFRSLEETQNSPNVPLSNSEYIHIDIFEKLDAAKIPNLERMLELDTPKKADDFLLDTYKSTVTTDTALAKYEVFIKHLLDPQDGAILFHCQAGKDRTGIASAIILNILGANPDDIIHDYLLTNEYRQAANTLLIEQIIKQGLPESFIPALQTIFQVKAEYLEYAFACIEQSFGNFDTFIRKGLLLDDSMIEKLKELYLH
jgi:Protein tyrosine/serine phosphatase